MRAGRLDRKITIQRKSITYSALGEQVGTWSDLATRRWASVNPVSGDERWAVPQLAAKQQTEFQVRWSSDIADLSPLDRVLYPVPADGSPQDIPVTSIYDVAAIHEIGRREGLRIIAVRRTDTA